MDILEIFENLGLGLGIIVLVIIIGIVFFLLMGIIPVLLRIFGNLLIWVIILIVIILAVYFIGKFAKGFLR